MGAQSHHLGITTKLSHNLQSGSKCLHLALFFLLYLFDGAHIAESYGSEVILNKYFSYFVELYLHIQKQS